MPANYVFKPKTRPAVSIAGSGQMLPLHRIYCVGRNYAAHAREMGLSDKEPPFFFSKPADAVTQAHKVPYPPATKMLHHEVELVVAIGAGGRNIGVEDALDHVFGYAVGVDLTRRDLQAEAKQGARPWSVAKGFDQSAPVSAVLRVSDAGHPASGSIRLSVDGETRQQGDLADMIWPVPEVIAELSRYFELAPGDLVFTGTPEGVGPLEPGSRIVCEIEGVGSHSFSITHG